jgi:hypothetical protein
MMNSDATMYHLPDDELRITMDEDMPYTTVQCSLQAMN